MTVTGATGQPIRTPTKGGKEVTAATDIRCLLGKKVGAIVRISTLVSKVTGGGQG